MKQNSSKLVLLADNDSAYRRPLSRLLALEGFLMKEAKTPTEALEQLAHERFDLVLVDLRLLDDSDADDISGMEVAKRASGLGIPCILVTAFPTVELARLALRSRGAEPFARDLITKASGLEALLDAISVILDRNRSDTVKTRTKGLFVDPDKRLVVKNGSKMSLSGKQYILLEALYEKAGGVCSPAELILAIYQEDVSEADARNDRRLKNLIERLKAKVHDKSAKSGNRHDYIETVYGQGYRLNHKN